MQTCERGRKERMENKIWEVFVSNSSGNKWQTTLLIFLIPELIPSSHYRRLHNGITAKLKFFSGEIEREKRKFFCWTTKYCAELKLGYIQNLIFFFSHENRKYINTYIFLYTIHVICWPIDITSIYCFCCCFCC